MRRGILLALALIVAAVGPGVVLAAPLWLVSANPTVLAVGTTTAIRLTVTNIGDDGGGSEIACVRIQTTAGFTIASAGIVSVYGQTSGAAYDDWETVWTGGSVVTFKTPSEDFPLIGSTPPTHEAVFFIKGTVPVVGAMLWAARAAQNAGDSGSTSCGSSNFLPATLTFVVAPATPTPTPKPTPTATPTPPPTPTLTPSPTPTLPPASPGPTRPPGATPTPGPTPPGSSAPSSSPDAGASPAIGPSASPNATTPGVTPAPPVPSDGSGGSSGDGISLGGDADGGSGVEPVEGIGGAAIAALGVLPGGVLAWAYPALVISVPGILLLLAIGAQAIGALAWLPLVRRRLGGFGLRRPDDG